MLAKSEFRSDYPSFNISVIRVSGTWQTLAGFWAAVSFTDPSICTECFLDFFVHPPAHRQLILVLLGTQ